MTELITRATVEEIVARRNRALSLYAVAADAITAASEALVEAGLAARVNVGAINRYNHHLTQEWQAFTGGVRAPDPVKFKACARRLVDTDFWAHIMCVTDLEKLMDKKAKDEFARQLQENPPEITVDNVRATLEAFAGDAKIIFQRGIANTFSALDRRFKSHDGWKIGSRVILRYCFNEYGGWSYNSHHRDTLTDIERAFLILDGKPVPPTYAGLAQAVENDRGKGGFVARQSFLETEYFRVRGFLNGNAHIWFKRNDLVEKVNRQLAEYYGDVIPEDRAPDADDGGLHNPKTTLAKNYGFFPTPTALADQVRGMAELYRDAGQPAIEVLEPSAGTGQLARACAAERTERHAPVRVDCIEIQPELAIRLADLPGLGTVWCGDFLKHQPTKLYDRVVMNPPFDRERDIDHVMHALKWLKPDGLLVAIMSAGTEFRETKKSAAFRAHIEKLGGAFRDLPPGSFSSVGTNVNTIVLKVRANGGRVYF